MTKTSPNADLNQDCSDSVVQVHLLIEILQLCDGAMIAVVQVEQILEGPDFKVLRERERGKSCKSCGQ